ncbi:C-terminal binding protein [Kamptonema cortianum]|nr:C-terminal binding protein [Kamptonema cortianum]MDL5054895.1 C-terminal binding protein [Oscillatoria laete-virens NRMC-F 0139]
MSEKIVLVTDYTWPSTDAEAQVLAEVGAKLLIAQTGSEEELLSLVPQADAILTCFRKVSAAVISAGEKLQVVGRYGIGVDNIAVDEATRRGIPVTNVPAYCLDEVAEHVLALLLAGARSICRYDSAVREGNWQLQTGMPIFRVRGRTLGIVGFGKIGQTLAQKARGLGLRIIAYDAYLKPEIAAQHAVELLPLDDLLAQADFVSLHTPLTPETQNLMNADRLRRMKPTACLINTSRGGIIDHDALVTALREGWIAGAALDVFVPEPLPADHPLLGLSNVIATPHAAFYSEESVLELEVLAAQNVAAILSGRKPAAVVNPEVLSLPRWAHLM